MNMGRAFDAFESDNSNNVSFIQAIGLLLSWQSVHEFRAKVRVRVGDMPSNEDQVFRLGANPRSLRYTLLNEAGEMIEKYDGFAHTRKRLHVDERLTVWQHFGTEAIAARLAFPMSLSVWDRPTDDYRFTGVVSQRDDCIELAIEHRKVFGFEGVVVVDPRRRMATRIETPGLLIAYDDVQIH